jgi:TctA family transporter
MIEKWVQTRRGHYRPGNYASLVSAETANNAGALTCLLPLLVLGIPLVPSEALLNELLTTKGTIMGQDFSAEFFMTNLAVVLVLTNAIGLIMAWPFARYICYLQRVPQYWLSVISLCLVIFSVWIVGAKSWQGEYNMLVFVMLLPLGYMLRHVDTLPLIFVFIVQSRLESTATTMVDLL